MTTSLDTRSKDTIVGTIAAGMQGRLATFLNFAVGSVFRAVAEAHAGATLWLQKEFVTVLALTRASTSDGDDLASWMAQYGLVRLPARAATGLVTFGRYSASGTIVVVPVGAVAQTGDGALRFAVYADPTNGAYSAASGGYVMLPGAATVSAPVAAITAGTTGNIAAGAITLVGSAMPGVDLVTNPAALSNGLDAESDADLRARFVLFINSLSKATPTAIGSAVRSVQQGLRYTITENIRPDGVTQYGYVTVYIDDGSGNPSAALIATVAAAVDAVRAAGVQVSVIGASTLPATVSMVVSVDPSYYAPDVVAAVTAALSVYINALPLGAKLRYTRLEQIAYDASPGVTNVTAVLLNGGTVDLTPAAAQTIKATSLVINSAA
jgi:uncharacterized phage protein gp47/JayE